MAHFVEARHEIKLQRRLADVRPWSTRAAESLGQKFNLMFVSIPLVIVSFLVPAAALVLTLPLLITVIAVHKKSRPTLPLRYPAFNAEPDPSTKKRGDGIMFFGNQESSNQYDKFKEIWASDDDLRKHLLILGSTGSGKSETLKSLFFNALCWSSGFFIADGKADNKLPTDVFTMARSVGRDDDLLFLNFLLAGKTPEQVRRSTKRRTNKLNPFSSADADTIIQMGANMLPKVEGEGKNWQEKALNLWRALVVALCYKRDTNGFELSVSTLIDYMALPKIEELYMEGYREMMELGEWSYGFVSIKTYLDSGCPAYKIDKLLAKHGVGDSPQAAAPGFAAPRGKQGSNDQDSMAYEQHAYRTSQLMPVLNLLDKTYGHIFRDKYPEIDMVDVTLNNRIMVMLIPSLEKSAQEAENLGKLAIACLRVMMARNLGAGIEGTRAELLDSKATAAPYPYLVALDELGYYFSDGIAVIFAQARSLGFSMIPAAQDLEKLTEGARAAEAGAMMANSVTKIIMRIDDAKKTLEFVQSILQKATVAVYRNYEINDFGWKRKAEVDLVEIERVPMEQLQAMKPGGGVINAQGKTIRMSSYYMDGDLKKHRAENFYVLRFLQVPPPTDAEVYANSIPLEVASDPLVKGEKLRSILAYERRRFDEQRPVQAAPIFEALKQAAARLPAHVQGEMRAIALYVAARKAVLASRGVSAGGDVSESDQPEPQVRIQPQPTSRSRPVVEPGAPGAGADTLARVPRAARAAAAAAGLTQPAARVLPGASAQEIAQEPDEAELAALDAYVHGRQGVAASSPGASLARSSASMAAAAAAAALIADASEHPVHPMDSDGDGVGIDLTGEDFLNQMFGPEPFARKAIDAMRAADAEDLQVSRGEAEQRLIDPVQVFLTGMRSFNMPRVLDVPADESAADAVLDSILQASPTASSPLAAPRRGGASARSRHADEDDWIESAVSAAIVQTPSKPDGAKTAVGFTEVTAKNLKAVESAFGNPEPEKAVRRLEKVVSAQITPDIAPQTPLSEDDAMSFLEEFDGKWRKP